MRDFLWSDYQHHPQIHTNPIPIKMFDDETIDVAFTPTSKEPPPNSSETWSSESLDQIKGWLRRHTPGKSSQWEWSYCTVQEGLFKIFSSESKTTPNLVFNFRQLTSTIENRKEKQFVMEFHSCYNQFIFKTRSKQERQQWLTSLNINIAFYSPMNEILTVISSKPEFWKYEKISNLKFISTANTGDILLFQAKNIGAKIQRKLARSAFDHAALLLCHASGKISVFEATNAMGVALADWDEFFSNNWIELYDRIIYRKLEVERTDEMLRNLELFVENSKGKKFGFGAGKMMKNGKKVKPGQEEDFFCSELIASAFKAVGLLGQDCDTSKVWPGDFERDDGIKLLNGRLGPLVQIDFDLVSMDGI